MSGTPPTQQYKYFLRDVHQFRVFLYRAKRIRFKNSDFVKASSVGPGAERSQGITGRAAVCCVGADWIGLEPSSGL